jgi:hypothetical protein
MSHLKFTTSLGAAILVAALAACSGSATSPNNNSSNQVSDQQISTDVANATSPDAAGDAADFSTEGNSGADFGLAAIGRPGSMVMGSTVHAMTACGPSTTVMVQLVWGADNQDTVDFNRTREWFADGACASTWTPSVDSVEWVGTWAEDLSNLSGTSTLGVGRVRNSSVYGAASGSVTPLDSATTHIWNANAVVNDTIHYQGTVNTRNYVGLAYDTAASVTFNHPRAGEIYPASGTWTRWATWNLNVTGAITETKTVQRHILVTFNGTQFVTLDVLDVTSGAVVLKCTVDLNTHRIVAGSCQAA